jgi:hypothetical protein
MFFNLISKIINNIFTSFILQLNQKFFNYEHINVNFDLENLTKHFILSNA